MREIEQKIIGHPRFPEFCLREKKLNSTKCKRPLTPLNIFYGEENPKLSTAELALFDDERVCHWHAHAPPPPPPPPPLLTPCVLQFSPVITKYQQLSVLHPAHSTALSNAVASSFNASDASYVAECGQLYSHLINITKGFTGRGPLQVLCVGRQLDSQPLTSRLCSQSIDDTLALCQKLFSVPQFVAEIDYFFVSSFPASGKSQHSRALIRCMSCCILWC